jgi:hypothetical protein
MLFEPDVLKRKALLPKAMLLYPVVFEAKAEVPKATF